MRARRPKIRANKRRRVIERDGGRCQWCGVRCREDVEEDHPLRLNIDHVIPHSQGGRENIDNLQVLCHTHNQEKADGGGRNHYRIGEVLPLVVRRRLFEMVGHPKASRWRGPS